MTDDDFNAGVDGIPNTVDDVFLLPIAGIEVSIIGLAGTVVTDANGEFILDPVPSGTVKLALNGMPVDTGSDFYFPHLVLDVDVQPGIENFGMAGMRHMYLPRIPTAILQNVTAADGMMIVADAVSAPDLTAAEQQFLTIEIQPNSLIGPNGESLTGVQKIGVSTVPPELVMDMLPPGVLQHTFDITVQAPGISGFSAPAPMTFPNLFGAAPGSKLNFLSFDPTTGLLAIEGAATVSADGLSVSTDPNTGVTHPGWHGLAPPGTESDPPCDPKPPRNIIVAPIPVTLGLVDRWSKDDSGSWTYSFGNAAKLRDPSEDPCHPANIRATPLVVRITVDGPAGDFLKGLSSQTFELMPGQQKSIQFDVKDLIPGVKNVNKDRLYGVRVIIKGWRHGKPGTLLLDKKVYVYRFFDVADDDHDDGIVEFADTLNDGLGVVQRPREIERHMHSAPLQYEPVGLPALPATLQTGESFSFDLIFDPSAIGLQRGIIQILSDDPETPNLNLSAIGVGLADVGSALDYGNDFVAFETPFMPGSPVLRTISDDRGNWQFFLPSDQPFHTVICDPISGLCAHSYDVSAASGQPTVMQAPQFLPPISVDTDGDGLTDDWEFAVGTSADKSDTDGLSDFVEVMEGLDPFGGLAFPTGVIASLDLVGEAKEVVVEQVTDKGASQIAYVATGSDGLSLVDSSQFDDPILLSRIALAGDNADVAVDTSLSIAAVTGGSNGLHLVDVSDRMAPSLIQTVALTDGAARVETFEGVAYVASGGDLVSVDLLTGEIIQIQTLVLGGVLTDVVREGTMLYTMDTLRNLRAVDISGFDMLARGSRGLAHGAGRLFAGNGIVYATAQDTVGLLRGGFSTVDVSDPDDPTLISQPDVTPVAPRADFKANGSGLGLLVGLGTGAETEVNVMNVLDPADTNVFQTGFQLPVGANSVFIASGIGFVADGAAGLQVVNYLGFDNQGVPPGVTLTSPVADLDPATAGIQVAEGSSLAMKVDVTDDFQVRSVDLLVNGEIVGTDVSFPFDLFAIAVSEGSTVEVRARATDTGGNSALYRTRWCSTWCRTPSRRLSI